VAYGSDSELLDLSARKDGRLGRGFGDKALSKLCSAIRSPSMPCASSHRPIAESGWVHADNCGLEASCQGESSSNCNAFEIGTIRNKTPARFGRTRTCIAQPRPNRTSKTPLYSDTSSVTFCVVCFGILETARN
jgi:hypothetical protein